MHLCSITKRQSWEQEQLPKVAHKTSDRTVKLSATGASALTHPPLPLPRSL